MKCLDDITDSVHVNLSKLREIVKDGRPGMLQSVGSQRVRHDRATEQQVSTILISEREHWFAQIAVSFSFDLLNL